MKHMRINDHDMAYIELGRGPALVCIHGSLGDFRSWSAVMGPLSRHYRLIVPSLRHFFPEHWDGKGGRYSIPQHVADVIAFIEGLGGAPVHLMGHSRGGHIAFRVAQQRPELVARLIMAEPGGELEPALTPPGLEPATSSSRSQSIVDAAAKIAAGDIDGGLELFVDRIDGAGTWARRPGPTKQRLRDNAGTLIGQLSEQRQPFLRAEAAALRMPSLLIGGADTKGMLPIVLHALAEAIPGARKEMIPLATHAMIEQAPQRFSEIVVEFLGA